MRAKDGRGTRARGRSVAGGAGSCWEVGWQSWKGGKAGLALALGKSRSGQSRSSGDRREPVPLLAPLFVGRAEDPSLPSRARLFQVPSLILVRIRARFGLPCWSANGAEIGEGRRTRLVWLSPRHLPRLVQGRDSSPTHGLDLLSPSLFSPLHANLEKKTAGLSQRAPSTNVPLNLLVMNATETRSANVAK